MKQGYLLLAVLAFTWQTYSQNLKKPSAFEITQLPSWAQQMYSDNPNLLTVSAAYKAYYTTHPFEENYHTQYFKRWIRTYSTQINDAGYIVPATASQLGTKPTLNKSSSWSVIGPLTTYSQGGGEGNDQANIYSLDQCAASPNTLICGTEPGEVYKSIDGGTSWTCISMTLDFSSGVTALEISPTNPQVFFAGGNNGVYRTVDGGSTWTNVLPNTNFGVNEILIVPGNENIVLVASDKGLHRSTNGGSTWTPLWTDACYDIKPHATNSQEQYLVKHDAALNLCVFLKSTDYGATWAVQSNGWFTSNDPARNDGGAPPSLRAGSLDVNQPLD